MFNDGSNTFAAIDLGTNTFHILIGKRREDKFDEIFRKRFWINLAEDGLEEIGKGAIERAWKAMEEIKKAILEYSVSKYEIVATEAFRTSSNGALFLKKVETEFQLYPKIISGIKEAQLIYQGASWISKGREYPFLIIDIGGGSTEFILYNETGIIWSQSFKAGVTLLYNNFVNTDPMTEDNKNNLICYLEEELQELRKILKDYSAHCLIGASGSFEVLESMSGMKPKFWSTSEIKSEEFKKFYAELLPSTLEDRLSNDLIPDNRAKLIVTALILINYVLTLTDAQRIHVSPFAMKEGILRNIINDLDESKNII